MANIYIYIYIYMYICFFTKFRIAESSFLPKNRNRPDHCIRASAAGAGCVSHSGNGMLNRSRRSSLPERRNSESSRKTQTRDWRACTIITLSRKAASPPGNSSRARIKGCVKSLKMSSASWMILRGSWQWVTVTRPPNLRV